MTAWFGPSWDAPVNEGPHVATPVGQLCLWCVEAIEEGDAGVLMPALGDNGEVTLEAEHRDCFLRSVLGSVGHLSGRCSCHGGDQEDPPGMTIREAATAAVAELWAYRDR